MNQYVDINTIVESASSVLPKPSDEEKANMREWAYVAMKSIGPTKADIKTETQIPVNDGIVMKPDDMVYMKDISLLTSDLKEIPAVFEGYGLPIHNKDEQRWNYIHISERPGYFQLSSNSGNVKWAKITYWGMPLDEDGLPKIPEIAELPVIMFIRASFYAGRGEEPKYFENLKQFNRYSIKARAELITPDEYHGREFAKSWPSMIDKAISKLKYNN